MTGLRHRWRHALAATATLLALSGCALLTPLPDPTSTADRLKAFPTTGLPLDGPVTVSWNEQQVPFIEAGSDHDAAFTLGLVHAHLRLGQMEILRHIARGRLAELGGPLALDLDRALRILNFGQVAPQVVAAMAPPERAWLEAFVAGINHSLTTTAALPHEFALLGLGREPWSAEDVVTIGRLASTDVNWLVWFRLLALRQEPGWPELWRRLVGAGSASVPSFSAAVGDDPLGPLETVLGASGRFGSNSYAVAGRHSRSGHALIATDPHLGLNLPNLWLIAGLKSPSYHMVGLMVPGLPFVAVGRNPWIGWGGTNLRAANSDLIDVSSLSPAEIRPRQETIKVRWWLDSEFTVRETAYGPIISDAPMIKARPGEQFALSWIGHRPSDELSAMLRLNRARDWQEFRAALDGFAVSPQNFIFADVDGHVGQVTATQLPARPPTLPVDLVQPLSAAAAWQRIVTARELPVLFDPPAGFVASANNRPAQAAVPIGWFFSANDRVLRLQELLSRPQPLALSDLQAIQRDVYQSSAINLRNALAQRWQAAEAARRPGQSLALSPAGANALGLIAGWDGQYRADSAGALAFEVALLALTQALYDEPRRKAYSVAGRPFTLITEDLPGFDDERLVPAMVQALEAGGQAVDRYKVWGELHRMAVQHLLGSLPLIGGRYRLDDVGVGGSGETLLKTGHAQSDQRHQISFGANARHLSDLGDPDANWFVLMGGQDGWFNSSSYADQVPLWQSGQYLQVPLTPARVHQELPYRLELTPASPRATGSP